MWTEFVTMARPRYLNARHSVFSGGLKKGPNEVSPVREAQWHRRSRDSSVLLCPPPGEPLVSVWACRLNT